MKSIYEADTQPVITPDLTRTREAAETWAAKKGTPAWLFSAARTFHGWPQGRELTEAEFDAAVSSTQGIHIRG